MRTWSRLVVLMAVPVVLVACGGGGGTDEEGGGPAEMPPRVTEEPDDTAALEGRDAHFRVASERAVTTRWQRDGVDLADGPDPDGAIVEGAETEALAIDPVPLSWSGSTFRAMVTGPGGSATSRPATLIVIPRSQVGFFTDFEEAEVRPELDLGTAPAARDGVSGFAGLGNGDEVFAGQFLRSPTGNTVTLTLVGLPDHTSLDLAFLFAAIDSLDGTGTFPSGDFFTVTVDGVQVFRESFANATASQVQSYVPPDGVELARRVDLGFQGPGGYFTDSAYDLGRDPALQGIPHTAATTTITFVLEGPGIQPLTDESWAMDRLRVTVNR